jgi:hypothetical protein
MSSFAFGISRWVVFSLIVGALVAGTACSSSPIAHSGGGATGGMTAGTGGSSGTGSGGSAIAGTGGGPGDGLGGAGSGGTSAAGGSAGGGGVDGLGCPVPQSADGSAAADPNMISDFEDGFASVLRQGTPLRNGAWHAYNDQSPTCMESPPLSPPGVDLQARATLNDPTVTGGACNSRYAFRIYGSGCTMFVGVQTDLNAPLVDGGATGPAVDGGPPPLKIPYDASGFKAVTFWGRTGTMSVPVNQTVHFTLPMLVDTKTTEGGTCVDTVTNRCSASYGIFLTFTPAWKQYTVNLDPLALVNGISQESWGAVFTWDPTNVVSLQFQPLANSTFDVWIDDIAFVPK